MKKIIILITFITLASILVSCKTKRKILGNKEIYSNSKEWISFSQNQIRVFQKSDGAIATYSNSEVQTYFEEQIVECDQRIIGGSVCEGYNMQNTLFEYQNSSGLPSINYKLRVLDVANGSDYYDLLTVTMGNLGSSKVVYPDPVSNATYASYVEQYSYADTLTIDGKKYSKVCYFKDTNANPTEIYFTKNDGVVAFKEGTNYWHLK